MEIFRSMRFRALRFLIPALAAPLLPARLAAQDAVTRVAPVPLVPFRGVAFGRDMNLREAPPAAPSAPTTAIVRPSAPPAVLPPAPAVAKAVPHKPAAPAVPPPPFPLRSLLPHPEQPAAPLPPGGRDLALQPTTFTPYDRYLGSVRSVMNNLEPHETTMTAAARLMKAGHRFAYCVCDPYRADPPALTEARRAGDCKSKALWLYDSLGDRNALFVIGKAEKRARTSHAWVYWRFDERWWILDCTERADPIAADSVSSDRYVPYYSFTRGASYRHKATRLMLTGAIQPSAKPVAGLR